MAATDANKFRSGGSKLNFVCAKRVFSMLDSPYFEKFTENLICEEIVLKMNLPILNKKCESLSISGVKTEAVGIIKTTVQCLRNGFQTGNVYLKARVVRDFYKLFGADGLCSEKLRKQLLPSNKSDDDETEDHADNDPDEKKSDSKKQKSEPTKLKPPHLASAKTPKRSNKRVKKEYNSPSSACSNTPPSFTPTSSAKKKACSDTYTNRSVILDGVVLNNTITDSEKKFAYYHLGRPIPRELMSAGMPHGKVWCNPRCKQEDIPHECGYYKYQSDMCGRMCAGKFCDHHNQRCRSSPAPRWEPVDHQLHAYLDVVDGTPPQSPSPQCQGNYIKYSVLNPVPIQRSPGGGPLKKWTPWYYDRRTHDYSYTTPEEFDPDGSFHSVRSMSPLGSSPGVFASDGAHLYRIEDVQTSPARARSPRNPYYNFLDQLIVQKLVQSGQNLPETLQHVPLPHGEEYCNPDCLWQGIQSLPYECGYHPDWGPVVSCNNTCPGGWCVHMQDQEGDPG